MVRISRYLNAQQLNERCKGAQSFLNAQLVHFEVVYFE